MSKWSEIRNTFCDDVENKVYIDAWKTLYGGEEGKVVAKVDVATKEVEYIDEAAKTDPYAQEIIAETIQQIESGEWDSLDS